MMLKRTKTLLRIIYKDPKLLLRAGAFSTRAFSEGIPLSIERIQHLTNPKRYPSNSFYNKWLKHIHQPNKQQENDMAQWATQLSNPPIISILLPVYNSRPKWLKAAIDSVVNQIYPHWELCIADDASSNPKIRKQLKQIACKDKRIKLIFRKSNGHISHCTNSALQLATGKWLALLDHDDLLSKDALIWVAQTISKNPTAKLIYSDEDKFRSDGRHTNPYFKSEWDPIFAEGQNMFSHLGVYNADLVRSLGGFRPGFEGSQDYDLLLRCIDKIDRSQIIHIPRILYHMRIHQESSSSGAKPYSNLASERAMGDHLRRQNIAARVVSTPHGFRVIHQLTKTPLVSLVIPSRNKLNILKPCIDSILSVTNYQNYEILIIDNSSDEPNCLAYLNEIQSNPKVKVIRDPRPFNYSALMNNAVSQAEGELIGLLNNDVVVLQQDWLEEMIGQVLRPGTGAVGAKLLYPNGTMQHGGVVLGIGGVAGHAHLGLPEHEEGYFRRAVLTQEISAVTAAALLVHRSHYLEVGGFNAENLSIAFNDVDFCLKLKAAGYRNIFTPFAKFIHHESASRGSDNTPETSGRFASEVSWMQERWGELLTNDPAYNPNLSLDTHHFNLTYTPRLDPFTPESK